jgi:hypothetical protein
MRGTFARWGVPAIATPPPNSTMMRSSLRALLYSNRDCLQRHSSGLLNKLPLSPQVGTNRKTSRHLLRRKPAEFRCNIAKDGSSHRNRL